MAIKILATEEPPRVTSSLAIPKLDKEKPVELSQETLLKLYTLVETFLLLNPKPSDIQVHSLALALGLTHEFLESLIYEMFAEVLADDQEGSPEEVGEIEPTVSLLDLDEDDLDGLGEDSDDFGFGSDDLDSLDSPDESEDLAEDIMQDSVDPVQVYAADAFGEAAGKDGSPDMEQLGEENSLKEALDHYGPVDFQQVQETLKKDES